MRIVVHMVMESEDGTPPIETEIIRIDRGEAAKAAEAGLGLTLTEAKATLAAMQKGLVATQAKEMVARSRRCTDCGAVLKVKDSRELVYRTVLGKMRLPSPRLFVCGCQAGVSSDTFSPLAAVLTHRKHPELEYLTTRWAAILPYAVSWTLLSEILPVGDAMSCSSVKNTVRRIGQWLESEISAEIKQAGDGRPAAARAHRVDTNQGIAVEVDAGYIRCSEAGSRWFSAVVARVIGTEGAGACHGFVSRQVDSAPSRMDRFLARQGIHESEPLAVISDGGEDVLGAGYLYYRCSQQLLDWFHIAMRFQPLWQALGPINCETPGGLFTLRTVLERAKWRLWHYQPVVSFGLLDYLRRQLADLSESEAKARSTKLLTDLSFYLRRNERFLGDYAGRYRAGLPIASGTAESTVNCVISKRFVKKQQMRWSPEGANALLQIRCAVLNGEYRDLFAKWYPGVTAANDTVSSIAA